MAGGLGDDKLALMAFDAGLMQDFGVAHAVAPFADLFLASQDALADFQFYVAHVFMVNGFGWRRCSPTHDLQ